MVQNAPPPSNGVPPELQQALTARRLSAALEAFQSGQWLDNAALFADEDTEAATYVPDKLLTEEEWAHQMADAFASIELGQYLQAAREFQEINFRTQEPKRLLLSRNALSLAFFKQGDYTQCEKVYEEFRNLLTQSPISPDSELARDYRRWLEAVDALPEDAQPFFSPFGGNRSTWNASSIEQIDFWQEFESCVSFLGERDHVSAVGKLQRIEVNLGPQLDPLQAYLTSVLFLASFVMAGDHSEVQEMTPQVSALEAQAVFPPERIEEVSDMLRWAGFESLSRRLAGGAAARTSPLNPWEDLIPSES
jgi:tetratricopeptide (TPR) repeat protein